MDLATSYLGLPLRNPLVASASPLSNSVERVRRLVDAGIGAVVLYSLFEEQLRQEDLRDLILHEAHEGSFGEALSYFPSVPAEAPGGARRYLDLIERAAQAVDVPVIASLNAGATGAWVDFARLIEEAGAAALELNIFALPGDPHTSGRSVEDRHLEILQQVRAVVSVPIAVKLSPHFSSVGEMALRLNAAGADGLVLFNRFLQPDIDLRSMRVEPGFGLSSPDEARLPRTWIALLRRHLSGSLAATTGVDQADDVVKYLLAGADVVMTASALLRHGADHVGVLLDGLGSWLELGGYHSVAEVRGLLAVPLDVDRTAYERAGYVVALEHARATYAELVLPRGSDGS
ncbi:MAG: dihydroorotate dehydrogenase-like protein [Terracoccus sp.]